MKNPKTRNTILAVIGFVFIVPALLLCGPTAQTASPGEERIDRSIEALKELMALPPTEQGMPASILRKCRGIAIFPGVIKAAYGIGGQFGKGIVLVKSEAGEWSDPAFVSLVGGSIGWQIGVQKADIILVFKTAKSIENIAEGKITLGADLSVAAGPVGRQAEASTDLDMEAEIYSYSKSKGLFAGVSLKGASIQADREANAAFYGRRDISANDILQGRGPERPPVIDDLKRVLERYTTGLRRI